MVFNSKSVSLLSCVLLLGLWLSQPIAAEEIGGSRVNLAKTIKGEVLRIDYGNYVVKEKDGKEISLHTDKTTQMRGQVKKGDRIEAKIDDQNHALSMFSFP
jgi:hypothetical protein